MGLGKVTNELAKNLNHQNHFLGSNDPEKPYGRTCVFLLVDCVTHVA